MIPQNIKTHLLAARVVLVLSALALIAVALALFALRPAAAPVQTERQPETVMREFLTDRDTLRADEIEQLKALSEGDNTSEDIRAAAQRRIMQLLEWMEQEATIEEVLSARGYAPVLVTVHSDSVNVLIETERLMQSDAAIILELVSRETGMTGGNIKIIPIN